MDWKHWLKQAIVIVVVIAVVARIQPLRELVFGMPTKSA